MPEVAPPSLRGRRVLLGVCGSVAAYKSVVLLRQLQCRGAEVRVVMSEHAERFVGAATFHGLTSQAPLTSLWRGNHQDGAEPHVALGAWAEITVVAPATLSTLAKLAGGIADGPLLATVACSAGTTLVAPAMHQRMWQRSATARVIRTLQQDGIVIVGPESGPLASGEIGIGRMSGPETITAAIEESFTPRDLVGKRIVISAGPTHEALDAVRYLGNRSSGKMGYALATAAQRRGADVHLISGPVALAAPSGLASFTRAESAEAMHAALVDKSESADALIMAAAIADFRPKNRFDGKLRRQEGDITLEFAANPDILADLAQRRGSAMRPYLVGFALESRDAIAGAHSKLERKGVDMVVANLIEHGLGGDTTAVSLVTPQGEERLTPGTKEAVAHAILEALKNRLAH